MPMGIASPMRRTMLARVNVSCMRRGISSEGKPGPLPTEVPWNVRSRRSTSYFPRSLIAVTALLGGAAFGVYCMDSRAGVHRYLIAPALQILTDPETASKFAITVLEHGMAPRDCGVDHDVLHTELFGESLTNPIGIAAGFDKQAQAIDGLFDLGFGMVEVGSVTPEPQPGNPSPRAFRLPLDAAMINRYGFNSDGLAVVHDRLTARLDNWVKRVLAAGRALVCDIGTENRNQDPTQLARAQLFANYPGADVGLLDEFGVPRSLKEDRLLAINLGKNKTSPEDSVADYVEGVKKLGPFADMVVINVSSPNTPGLRRLQRRSVLEDLLKDVSKARDTIVGAPNQRPKLPLLVKVSPDLSDTELQDISDAVENTGVDGIIVSNTTVTRPPGMLSHQYVNEIGGLSGPPVKPLALHALSVIHARNQGRIPLIGCGGISSGADALEFAKAGASAVQLYTALAYQGAGLPRRIKDELTDLLKAEGKTWKQVVGSASALHIEPYAPDLAKGVHLIPGAQDAFDRSVVSLRNEIEHLRHARDPDAYQHTERRRAVPFQVDPQDHQYIQLLDRVHRVLDHDPHFEVHHLHPLGLPQPESSVPENALATAAESNLTQGEILHQAVQEATHVPVPSVHQSTSSTNSSSNSPTTLTKSGLRLTQDKALSEKLALESFRETDRHRVI
ncbi:hypothetical protein MYAM1_003276 [Malassezia yamatoensis]|uniref:Dihydroorotate dehydrogenase (quinone), mitochondrial n=1 Tax=Malassezia yamatoensis TaxID=253288 RepID=A0AAJ6CKA5_9BASI|nr:hypothetical protein MYAM1_003276 [Malassezia yamatoensis]